MIEAAVEALLDDVDNHENGSQGARDLAEAARRGVDIEAAVGALGHALDQATQIGLLAEAATALVLHLGNRGEPARILEAIGRHELGGAYVCDALLRDEVDLGSLLPGLFAPGAPRCPSFERRRVLEGHVGRDQGRLAEVVALLGGREPALVLELIDSVAREDAPGFVEPALPVLAAALAARGDLRKTAARLARRLVEAGVELGPARQPLRNLLRSRRDELAGAAAYALALEAGRRGAWEDADALRRRRREALRFGAYRSLVRQYREGRTAEVVERLARGLLDGSGRIRQLAMEELLDGARDLRPLPPLGDALLEELVAAHERGVDPDRLGEFLYEVGAFAREGDPPCAPCLVLPRQGRWDDAEDLPTELQELEGQGPWRTCPRCKAVYSYTYEEECEDMYVEQTWTLRRLSPTEVLATPEAPLRDWYREEAEHLLREARARLGHPKVRLREDAAWVLVEDALAREAWDELGALLTAPDAVVRRAAWAARARLRAVATPPRVLRPGLADEDDGIRRRAAELLAREGLRAGDPDLVRRLLRAEDPVVKKAAAYQVDAVSREGADVVAYLDELLDLARAPEEEVRRPARWVLSRTGHAPEVLEARLALAMEHLASGREELQEEAAISLPGLLDQGVDVAPAIPHLRAMLGRAETAWHAVEALARLTPRVDVSAALPSLVEGIEARTLEGIASPEKILRALREAPEVVAPYLPRLVPAMREVSAVVRSAIYDLVLALGGRGHDLLEYASELEATFPSLEGYQLENLGKLLGRARLEAGHRGALDDLLRHPSRAIQWGAREALGEAFAAGAEVAAHAPALIAQLSARNRYHREGAADLVRALWTSCPDVRGEVVRELRRVRASRDRDRLISWIERGGES